MKLKPLWAYKPEGTMFLSSPAMSADGKKIFEAGCQSDLGGYTGILSCAGWRDWQGGVGNHGVEGMTFCPHFSVHRR